MMFETIPAFLILSMAGIVALGERLRPLPGRIFQVVVVCAAISVLIRDLPLRFGSEYSNYLSAPAGVRNAPELRSDSPALVFFEGELAYASYMPFNNVHFNGSRVYAKSLGPIQDYRLLSSFPGHRVFYSNNGNSLRERPNFFTTDLKRAGEILKSQENVTTLIILPWRDVTPNGALGSIADDSYSPQKFLRKIQEPQFSDSRVLLIDTATSLEAVLRALFYVEELEVPATDLPVRFLQLGSRRAPSPASLPGFWLTCFANRAWISPAEFTSLVDRVDVEDCPGEERSALWEAYLELDKPENLTFSLESDDGASLSIDDDLVLDNGLSREGVRGTVQAVRALSAGAHRIQIHFFNGPGPGKLGLSVREAPGPDLAFAVASLPNFKFRVSWHGP